MGRKSSIDKLPDGLRSKLVGLLADPSCTQRDITDAINAAAGETVVSLSAVNRYAQKMQEFTRRSIQAKEVAKAYLEQTRSETANTLGKVAIEQLRLIVFDILGAMDDLPKAATDAKTLAQMTASVGKIARGLKDLEQAAEGNLRIEEKVKAKTASVADEAEAVMRTEGLSDLAIKAIKAQILGIAG